MKKYLLSSVFVALLFAPIITFSQGSCYADQSDFYWKISQSLYGSKRLSDCHPNAYYNCHGFVMSYFENGCTDAGWSKNQIAAPYSCPNNQGIKSAGSYQNSGKYVQVCSEANANIAYYKFVRGDHSAVKEVSAGGSIIKYLSKYNFDGPLVAHNLTGSWYHLDGQETVPPTPVQFWSYVGPILGNPNIVGLSQKTFNVNNISSVTYSWSIVSGNSNINISSASNQSSVTLTPTHSGTAVLRLNVSSACGTVKTQQITLNIQTNVCLEGSYNTGSSSGQHLYTVNSVPVGSVTATVTCPNATSYTWQKTSGTINSWFASGANVSFSMTSGGSITFSVTAKNGATTLATRNVTFYNYGSFMVYPNPSTTSLSIDVNKDIPFTVVLQSFDGPTRAEIQNYYGESKIDISTLKPGEYVLYIYHGDEIINQQRIIINK